MQCYYYSEDSRWHHVMQISSYCHPFPLLEESMEKISKPILVQSQSSPSFINSHEDVYEWLPLFVLME